MSFGLLFTLITASSLAIYFITYVAHTRNLIENMSGMVFAMAIGMMTGLVMATIAGVLMQGNLLASTIVGMLIGMTAGLLCGLPFGGLAVIDGSLSGMMGGMMGAMIGEMIPVEQSDLLIKMMFLLYVSFVTILFYLLKETIRKKKRIINNPLIVAIILGLFFVGYNQLEIFSASGDQNTGHQHGSQSQPLSKITVMADEFEFNSNNIQVSADKSIKLTLKNVGSVEHDIEIINLDSQEVHVYAAPGTSNTVTFTPDKTGTFRFICTIPGHKENGMVGTLKVI